MRRICHDAAVFFDRLLITGNVFSPNECLDRIVNPKLTLTLYSNLILICAGSHWGSLRPSPDPLPSSRLERGYPLLISLPFGVLILETLRRRLTVPPIIFVEIKHCAYVLVY